MTPFISEILAKTKWCPWSRLVSGVNRGLTSAEIPAGTRCMASACMAWEAGEDAKTGRCGLVGRQ
jgi:hypothetical protein